MSILGNYLFLNKKNPDNKEKFVTYTYSQGNSYITDRLGASITHINPIFFERNQQYELVCKKTGWYHIYIICGADSSNSYVFPYSMRFIKNGSVSISEFSDSNGLIFETKDYHLGPGDRMQVVCSLTDLSQDDTLYCIVIITTE